MTYHIVNDYHYKLLQGKNKISTYKLLAAVFQLSYNQNNVS